MVTIPKVPKSDTVDAIYKNWELNQGDFRRAHLGASLVGHSCTRFLFYSYRWVAPPRFPGRMLRLFDRGHRGGAGSDPGPSPDWLHRLRQAKRR